LKSECRGAGFQGYETGSRLVTIGQLVRFEDAGRRTTKPRRRRVNRSLCKRLRVYRKLATRADHRTNPSATYIGLGLSRQLSSTNLATTLELSPAMPAKPGGSGPTGAKDIKIRHHDDDQQCLCRWEAPGRAAQKIKISYHNDAQQCQRR
jgi:hypothetical protein